MHFRANILASLAIFSYFSYSEITYGVEFGHRWSQDLTALEESPRFAHGDFIIGTQRKAQKKAPKNNAPRNSIDFALALLIKIVIDYNHYSINV